MAVHIKSFHDDQHRSKLPLRKKAKHNPVLIAEFPHFYVDRIFDDNMKVIDYWREHIYLVYK